MRRYLKVVILLGSMFAMAACSTLSKEERAWYALLRNSDARMVTSDRLIVEAWGAPRTSMEAVELRLLARAGSEAERLGFSHFVILHIRDRNLPLAGGLNSTSIFGADEKRITTYEALVRDRYERDYAAAPRAWWNPGLTAVIMPLNAENGEDAFPALELYDTLNRTQLAR